MARAIDEKIIQLKVDKAQFESNLRAAAQAMSNLEKSINQMNGMSAVDKPASSFEKLKATISSISINPIKNAFDFVSSGASKIGSLFGNLFKSNPFSALSNMAKSAVSSVTGIFGGLGRLNPFKNTAVAAAESFGSIEKSANSVDLNGLSSNVENIASKFTVMGQVVQGVIQNISAQITGKLGQGVSTMFEGITGGYSEYTEKLKSINVIMNNIDNPNLGNVKDTLSELNTYADKTVYSFEDMTSNMGTFTAAGVGLKDSAVAIKGIGNLAASSGSTTQQMSTAMYQLSQALASGKVGLQDWNSVVNAGMGGQKFQRALRETAKSMGQNVDESVSFRDSLQDGWLTSDVLLKTLTKFSKDGSMLKAATQAKSFSDVMDSTIEGIGSGWAVVWENILGDSKQAPILWTNVNNAIGKPINAMSNYLQKTSLEFNKLGGRADIIKGLANLFGTLGKIVGAVGSAFKDVFPPVTTQQLLKMASGFKEMMANFKVGQGTLKNIHDTFEGLFSILKIGVNVIKAVAGVIVKMIPDGLVGNVLAITGAIGRFITGIANGTSGIKIFGDSTKKAGSGINILKDGLTVLGTLFETLKSIASAVGEALGPVFGDLAKQFMGIVNTISKSFAKAGGFDINKLLSAGLIVAIIKLVQKFGSVIDDVVDGVKNIGSPIKGMGDAFTETLENVGGALKAFTSSTKAKTVLEIGAAMLVLAASLQILSNIDNKSVFKSLEIFGAVLLMVNASLKSFAMISPKAIPSMLSAGVAMDLLAAAMASLSVSVFVLSKIKPEEMIVGLSGLAGVLTMVTAAMVTLGKNKSASISAGIAMNLVATAVLQLSASLAIISAIPLGGVVKGVAAIGAVLLELGLFVKLVKASKVGPSTAAGLVITAAAVDMIAVAVAGLGMMDVGSLVKGLATITATLIALAAFTRIASPTNLVATGAGLVLVAGALNVMAVGIAGLGLLNSDVLAQGLVGMGSALLLLVAAMKGATGGLAGAAAVLVMAGALNVLIPPIAALGAMGLPAIGTALLGLAGAFTVIGVAGALLAPVTPAVLGLAAAVVVMGVGMSAAGLGISAFVTAMLALAGTSAATMAALGVAIGMGLDAIISNIPKMVKAGVELIRGIALGIQQTSPYVAEKMLQTLLGILTAIDTYIPQIAAKGMQIVTSLAQAIANNIQPLIEAVTNLIQAFANGIAANMPTIIQSGLLLINTFAQSIRDNQQEIVQTVLNVVESIMEVIVEALARVVDVLFGWIPGVSSTVKSLGSTAKDAMRDAFDIDTVASDKVGQFNTNVQNGAPGATTAGMSLAQAAKGGIDLADFSTSGTTKGNQFNAGLTGDGSTGVSGGTALGNNAITGIKSVSTNLAGATKGSEFNQGINSQVGGAGLAGSTISTAARNAAGGIGFTPTGTNKGSEFVKGVNGQSGNAAGAGTNIGVNARNGAQGVSLTGTGSNKGGEFNSGVNGQAGNARGAGANLSSNARSGMSTADTAGTGSAKGNQFAGGVRSADGYGAGSTLAGKAKSGMGSADATEEGANLSRGFFNGIASWGNDIMAKAGEIAAGAAAKMKRALDEHSPSKVTRKIGSFAGQGLYLGIADEQSNVENVAERMANAAIEALSGTGQQIQDNMGNILDMSPTITPVLDMSNANASVLNGQYTFGAGFNPLSESFAQNGQQVAGSQTTTGPVSIYIQADPNPDLTAKAVQEALVGLNRR